MRATRALRGPVTASISGSSPDSLLRLSLSIEVLQEVIRKHRRRIRIRSASLAVGALALASSISAILLLVPPFRLFIGGPLFIIGAALIAIATVLGRQPILSQGERALLLIEHAVTHTDLELLHLEYRERRRQHPEPEPIEHQFRYQDDIGYYVDDLRARGTRSRRANNIVQVITIIGSSAATALGALAIANDLLQWWSPIITFAVTAASGVAAIYKFKDRSFYASRRPTQ